MGEVGALWENFIISERLKRNAYSGSYSNYWFWRTQQQKEIDYIEEEDGRIPAFQFKWSPIAKYPEQFVEAYPVCSFTVVTPVNIECFCWNSLKLLAETMKCNCQIVVRQ